MAQGATIGAEFGATPASLYNVLAPTGDPSGAGDTAIVNNAAYNGTTIALKPGMWTFTSPGVYLPNPGTTFVGAGFATVLNLANNSNCDMITTGSVGTQRGYYTIGGFALSANKANQTNIASVSVSALSAGATYSDYSVIRATTTAAASVQVGQTFYLTGTIAGGTNWSTGVKTNYTYHVTSVGAGAFLFNSSASVSGSPTLTTVAVTAINCNGIHLLGSVYSKLSNIWMTNVKHWGIYADGSQSYSNYGGSANGYNNHYVGISQNLGGGCFKNFYSEAEEIAGCEFSYADGVPVETSTDHMGLVALTTGGNFIHHSVFGKGSTLGYGGGAYAGPAIVLENSLPSRIDNNRFDQVRQEAIKSTSSGALGSCEGNDFGSPCWTTRQDIGCTLNAGNATISNPNAQDGSGGTGGTNSDVGRYVTGTSISAVAQIVGVVKNTSWSVSPASAIAGSIAGSASVWSSVYSVSPAVQNSVIYLNSSYNNVGTNHFYDTNNSGYAVSPAEPSPGTTWLYAVQEGPGKDHNNIWAQHGILTGYNQSAPFSIQGPNTVVATGLQPPAVAVNTLSVATYTLAASDANATVVANSASATTITIPPNATTAFPIGAQFKMVAAGSASLSVTGGTGVSVNGTSAGTRAAVGQWDTLTATQTAANQWIVERSA
jgi:hypothetical protein